MIRTQQQYMTETKTNKQNNNNSSNNNKIEINWFEPWQSNVETVVEHDNKTLKTDDMHVQTNMTEKEREKR